MKNTLKAFAILAATALPLVANAADKATDAPPQGTPVYPCWDMMKDGHMMQMRGMWHGGDRRGHMMMMQQQDVQGMQKEIDDLRKQVEELKKK